MITNNDRRGIQLSFAWIFAIVAGAFIIFLAVYGVTKVIDTGGQSNSAQTGKEIGVLLNPLETGFGESTTTLLSVSVDTQIQNRCSDLGKFGVQTISVSQKNFGKWSPTNLGSSFENKYLFSENNIEGTDFFLFSKSFNFPFKVADLVYITSSKDNYCFIDSPSEIVEELNDLNQDNIFTANCPSGSINVCFDSLDDSLQECDVQVRRGRKEVGKDGTLVYFETDALMYAAIFSDADIYECQVQRLMKRTGELLSIYDGKDRIISEQGCNSDFDLLSLRSAITDVKSSEEIFTVVGEVNNLDRDNDRARCQLW